MSVRSASRQVSKPQRTHSQRSTARTTSPVASASVLPPIHRLQRAVGNRGMGRFLSSGLIQTKFTVNRPGDRFEQEADRVADAVMRMPESQIADRTAVAAPARPAPIQRVCKECEEESARPAIQRMCDACSQESKRPPKLQAKETPGGTPEVTPEIAARIQSLQGGGQALPTSVRRFFEPRFGQDFSPVRVHTDVASTRGLQARAYTVGSNIVFGAGQYSPQTSEGKRLLAHELTHVVQQGGASPQPSNKGRDVIQRAGDPAAIPPAFPCPTDLTAGRPVGTDLLFPSDGSIITAAHTAQLTTFRTAWLAAGGTDDILIHGYSSTDGAQAHNWTLSCNRAQAVQAELVRLGIPAVRINVVAHGESTDFGPSAAPNRHAVVTSRSPGFLPLPLISGVVTARDNFASRSTTRFGVGETIDLTFFSFPPRPAGDFGGLVWRVISGGGTLAPGVTPNDGTATYTAPATAATVQLELQVATGATAGRVISAHTLTIVIPSAVRMVAIPGTAPTFGGTIPAGTWGVGFQANPFIDPKDVSFLGVRFGEGTVLGVVTPAGSFLSGRSGLPHPVGVLTPGGLGNAATGTPVLGTDNIEHVGGVTPSTVLGVNICGDSDFLWAIPWQFSVAGGPRVPFAGGFTANQHLTSTLSCNATVEKASSGTFCRRINGTTC